VLAFSIIISINLLIWNL